MGLLRGFFSGAAFASIALIGCTNAASAETIRPRPPRVYEIEVACHVVNAQRHTVRIQTPRYGPFFANYRVVFQNVQNASAAPLTLSPQAMPVADAATPAGEDPTRDRQYQFFDIPAGVYDVMIARPPAATSGSTELMVRNITVPATTGTGGRGTGCRFL